MHHPIHNLTNDPELLKHAHAQLSLIVLADHYPLSCARLFLDRLKQADLHNKLSPEEHCACTYYSEFLHSCDAISGGNSIRGTSELLELKKRLFQEPNLDVGWKISIADDFGQPFAVRDFAANLYAKAKSRLSASVSATTNDSEVQG